MAKELRRPSLEALTKHLFVDHGFHGSRTDYYNRANSYINEVMDDREGLPISLSVVFLELARRAGLKDVAGVPLPGHFMVRHKDQLIDVFDNGKLISRAEAEELIGMPLLDRYLEPASKRDIILRMVRNLQNAGSPAEAARYEDLIAALSESEKR
jgi:serine protease Do